MTHRSMRVAAVVAGIVLAAGCTSGAQASDSATVVSDQSNTSEVESTTSIAAPGAVGRDVAVAPPTSTPATGLSGEEQASTTLPALVAASPSADLTDDGVLAAAVIIVSGGDLETAIAEGLVSEAEAEAALAAIASGSLSDYSD